MSKENKNTAGKPNVFVRIGKTLARWTKRMFMGASRELTMDEKLAVEKLESPSVMAFKSFFRRPLAVIALVVLVSMFLFVFIGPSIWTMDINYTDPKQANVAPNYTFLKVPGELADNIKDINGFADFTIGVSQEGNVYVWGNTKNALSKIDLTQYPEEIKNGNVHLAAAGSNHIIAVTKDGKVVGWGNNNNGQYGKIPEVDLQFYIQEPDIFLNGTIDASKVTQVLCGYQCTGIVYDGAFYTWGNKNTLMNMTDLMDKFDEGVKKAAFTSYYGVVLLEDGSVQTGGNTFNFFKRSGVSNVEGKLKNLRADLAKRNIVDIAATQECFAFLTDEGEIIIEGAARYGEDQIPQIPAGEKAISIKGGTRHFVVLTDKGTVVSWGDNKDHQVDASGEKADQIFTGAMATYLADQEGELTGKFGFKGYLMGTDNRGRDVFTRIVHGGKMTMTIGAVAVIVSTIIAIILGCLSGYFGGWVDMLLMRVTEIFSAIPFLPFAMMLSYVIQTMPIDETTRIFIIMVMLGLLSWTGLARMIRAQVLAEREKEFVIAAKSMGIKEVGIAFKHILPNVISIILVNVTLDFAGCLLTESSLSYLGFGVQQPNPTWGNMLDGANNSIVIQNYWWQWVFPALFLAIATISINIIGDTLRDILDPKSSNEK